MLVGIVFGIVLVKSEAVSWYRIYEMFRFESIHMYGIIGTAVLTGIILLQLSKKLQLKNTEGNDMRVAKKEKGFTRHIFGGVIFGLGWALVGACPGPIYILIGAGFSSMIIVLLSATFGTFIYGLIKDKLPH